MNNDNKKKEALQKAAMEEFMEKGFTKASLRNICKNAGVTTGALYFFFQDKEDLFASLVQEPMDRLLGMVYRHMDDEEHEMEMISKTMGNHVHDFIELDRMMDMLYDDFDAIFLVLQRSEGSRFHGIEDKFINICEVHAKKVAQSYTEVLHGNEVSEPLLHWLAHDIVGIFLYIVEHRIPKKDAKKLISQATLYISGGFMSIIKGSVL